MNVAGVSVSRPSNFPIIHPSMTFRAVIKAAPLFAGDCDSNDPLFPTASKTSGTALGTIYKFEKHPDLRILGKVGYPGGVLADNPDSYLTRTKKEINIDSTREKIAVDVLQGLGRGRFIIPHTWLSRQPVMNKYSIGHAIACQWVTDKIVDTLRVMSQIVDGYQDFKLATTELDGKSATFMDFLTQCHRPPEMIYAPEGYLVPLSGLMETCAAARLLADTDALGGAGDNAGFVWEKNADDKIIGARTVKIDPGFAFQFSEPNIIYNTMQEVGNAKAWTSDLRNIQVANNNYSIVLHWEELTQNQQQQFIDALTAMIEELSNPKDLHYCFNRKGQFDRTTWEVFPENVVQTLIDDLNKWMALQKEIYKEEIASRKPFFYYPQPPHRFKGDPNILSSLGKTLAPLDEKTSIRVLRNEGNPQEIAGFFASRYRMVFSLIYWIKYDSEQTVEDSYRSLAETLGLAFEDYSLDQIRSEVHDLLENSESDRPWLLILDGIEEECSLPERGGSVLAISTRADLWEEAEVFDTIKYSPTDASIRRNRSIEMKSKADSETEHLLGNPEKKKKCCTSCIVQ